MSRWMSCTIMMAVVGLSGCGGPQYAAPVAAVTNPAQTAHYEVKSGETLYSIALKYNLDVKTLAGDNRIAYPYKVFSGQKLALKQHNVMTKRDVQQNIASQHQRWPWPVKGAMVSAFGVDKAQGVRIQSKQNALVEAVLPGQVVYSGTGVSGYGHLVIIEHQDGYMTAYGNNKQLLVQEGDRVSQGESIAVLGSNRPQKAPHLHFEVRYKGQPVDPVLFLTQNS